MENKLLSLLRHFKLESYYGDLLLIGVNTLEDFAKMKDEAFNSLRIPHDSEDFEKLKKLSALVKTRMEEAGINEKPETEKEADASGNESQEYHQGINMVSTEEKTPVRKTNWWVWLIVLILAVVVGIWYSGYHSAKEMVENGYLNMITLSVKVNNMNALKKSGFMYYVENRTDYNQRLKELTTF